MLGGFRDTVGSEGGVPPAGAYADINLSQAAGPHMTVFIVRCYTYWVTSWRARTSAISHITVFAASWAEEAAGLEAWDLAKSACNAHPGAHILPSAHL